MKTLIIPDIHNKYTLAECIIDMEEPDRIIFLGDYFDDYGDTPVDAYNTALWLKTSLNHSNRIHLIGNHDLSYMTNGVKGCIGWNGAKQMFVNKVGINWKLLYHYCFVGDWLCTHAGLSDEFYKAYNQQGLSPSYFIHGLERDPELKFRLYMTSPYRGGHDSHSGILWCDYNEFVDIPNLNQIFGHTQGYLRRILDKVKNAEHICLDTALHDYAVYNGSSIITKKVDRGVENVGKR